MLSAHSRSYCARSLGAASSTLEARSLARDAATLQGRMELLGAMALEAKNLERIGDHCTNIAKVVHFIATGEQIKSDKSSSARPEQAEDVNS